MVGDLPRKAAKPIDIAIADDHPLFIEGLKKVLLKLFSGLDRGESLGAVALALGYGGSRTSGKQG